MKRFVFGVVTGLLLAWLGYHVMTPSTPPTVAAPASADPDAYPLPADREMVAAPAADAEVPSGTRRVSLSEASDSQLVEYSASGTGSSSGHSMLLAIRNLSGSPLDVYVTPGTVLLPANTGEAQRMMVWGVVGVAIDEQSPPRATMSIYLPDAAPRLAVLEAYCLDFDLPNPEAAHTYMAAVAAQPAMASASAVYAAKREGLSIEATQIAVWKTQDDHITQQEIEHKFPARQDEFDKAFDLARRVRRERQRRG